jgi:hypothetical protein
LAIGRQRNALCNRPIFDRRHASHAFRRMPRRNDCRPQIGAKHRHELIADAGFQQVRHVTIGKLRTVSNSTFSSVRLMAARFWKGASRLANIISLAASTCWVIRSTRSATLISNSRPWVFSSTRAARCPGRPARSGFAVFGQSGRNGRLSHHAGTGRAARRKGANGGSFCNSGHRPRYSCRPSP